MTAIKLSLHQTIINGTVVLPTSKSIINRLLIMHALAAKPFLVDALDTSKANDTQILASILTNKPTIADAEDAGTAMRFLCAYYSIGTDYQVLTGSPRMLSRPIGDLVDALRSIGADIVYLGQDGYPPLKIGPFQPKLNINGATIINVDGSKSSQFVTSLMLIAPYICGGVSINILNSATSYAYIMMTAAMMRQAGIDVTIDNQSIINIPFGQYDLNYLNAGQVAYPDASLSNANIFTMQEADWSAAAFWYTFLGLAPERSTLCLGQLITDSIQGDSVIAYLMEGFGIKTNTIDDSNPATTIVKTEAITPTTILEVNFKNCPDLAQAIIVFAAINNLPLVAKGLHTLPLKETNRILALQSELSKVGVSFTAYPDPNPDLDQTSLDNNETKLIPQIYKLGGTFVMPDNLVIDTYNDHRMAMAFSILCWRGDLTILNPDVVKKSYPNYWIDLNNIGISTNLLEV